MRMKTPVGDDGGILGLVTFAVASAVEVALLLASSLTWVTRTCPNPSFGVIHSRRASSAARRHMASMSAPLRPVVRADSCFHGNLWINRSAAQVDSKDGSTPRFVGEAVNLRLDQSGQDVAGQDR